MSMLLRRDNGHEHVILGACCMSMLLWEHAVMVTCCYGNMLLWEHAVMGTCCYGNMLLCEQAYFVIILWVQV